VINAAGSVVDNLTHVGFLIAQKFCLSYPNGIFCTIKAGVRARIALWGCKRQRRFGEGLRP